MSDSNYLNFAENIISQISASEEECIARSSIEELCGMQTASFIRFMESSDLLERENDPDIFFLTPWAYELIESKRLDDYVKVQAGLLTEEDFKRLERKENDDEGFPQLIHLENFARPGGRSVYTTILLFALVMALVLLISNGLRPTSQHAVPENELSDERRQAIIDSVEAYLQTQTDAVE